MRSQILIQVGSTANLSPGSWARPQARHCQSRTSLSSVPRGLRLGASSAAMEDSLLPFVTRSERGSGGAQSRAQARCIGSCTGSSTPPISGAKGERAPPFSGSDGVTERVAGASEKLCPSPNPWKGISYLQLPCRWLPTLPSAVFGSQMDGV